MSVLIRGMEMPKSCYKCPLRRRNGMDIVCPLAHERFSVTDVNILEYRLDNCPLSPVPPHGDLIDRKVAFDYWLCAACDFCWSPTDENFKKALDATPTIIPAEEATP